MKVSQLCFGRRAPNQIGQRSAVSNVRLVRETRKQHHCLSPDRPARYARRSRGSRGDPRPISTDSRHQEQIRHLSGCDRGSKENWRAIRPGSALPASRYGGRRDKLPRRAFDYTNNSALRFPSRVKVVGNGRPVFSVGLSYIQLPRKDLASGSVWHRACSRSLVFGIRRRPCILSQWHISWRGWSIQQSGCVSPAQSCGWCCVWFDLPWFGPVFY